MTETPREPSSKPNPNLVFFLLVCFKMLPMIISGVSIFLGYRLFILGVTGKASLSIETNAVSGQLLNAAPGLFFAVGGMIALIFSIRKGFPLRYENVDRLGVMSTMIANIQGPYQGND